MCVTFFETSVPRSLCRVKPGLLSSGKRFRVWPWLYHFCASVAISPPVRVAARFVPHYDARSWTQSEVFVFFFFFTSAAKSGLASCSFSDCTEGPDKTRLGLDWRFDSCICLTLACSWLWHSALFKEEWVLSFALWTLSVCWNNKKKEDDDDDVLTVGWGSRL